MDKHELYEQTVQNPALTVELLRAFHGNDPRTLGEDFAGTAALARAWVAAVPGATAIAVDHDAEVLARPRAVAGVVTLAGDVRSASDRERHKADVIFAGNFSIGELHTRAELVRYFEHCHARLNAAGVFVCDTYGGAPAWRTGAVVRDHWTQDGARIRYIWEQRAADPTTAEVVNALHFRVERGGEVVEELTDAFVYSWRLWSAPELVDALVDAGFSKSAVHVEADPQLASIAQQATSTAKRSDPEQLLIVCVVARR